MYYLVEDVAAVNAGAGRPYREALAARYKASPRFQRMLYVQSIFWSVPAVLLAAGLTVPAVSHDVPADIAYGLCWAVPFLWCALWGLITIRWCKRDMVRERLEWEADFGGTVEQEKTRGGRPDPDGDRDTDASASTVVEQRGRLSSHRLDEAAVV